MFSYCSACLLCELHFSMSLLISNTNVINHSTVEFLIDVIYYSLSSILGLTCLFDAYFIKWWNHVHVISTCENESFWCSHRFTSMKMIRWNITWRQTRLSVRVWLWECSPCAFLTFNFHPAQLQNSERQLPATLSLHWFKSNAFCLIFTF